MLNLKIDSAWEHVVYVKSPNDLPLDFTGTEPANQNSVPNTPINALKLCPTAPVLRSLRQMWHFQENGTHSRVPRSVATGQWVCTCRRSLHLVNGTQPRYRLLVSVTSCCNTRVSGGYPPVGWVTNIGVTKGCSPESTGTTSFNLSNTSLQLRCQKHVCLHWKETQLLRLTSLGQGATGEGNRRTPIMGHPRTPDTF